MKTVPEAVRQPQVIEREMIIPVEDPVLGTIDVINSAPKFSDASVQVRGPAPTIGQHNTEVLAQVLGYAPEQIETLRRQGILKEVHA